MTDQGKKVNLEKAQLTVLLEINGRVHMVAMKSDRMQAIEMLVKVSAESVIPTSRSQTELCDFLGHKGVVQG